MALGTDSTVVQEKSFEEDLSASSLHKICGLTFVF